MLTSHQRRLSFEQGCLQILMAEYPDKVHEISCIDDRKFLVSVSGMHALSGKPGEDWQTYVVESHVITISFPRYYPAVPSEVFLEKPIFHPNVDPVNGFVCLWDNHRVTNTVRTALAKLASVLAWRLVNTTVPHIMQPDALAWYQSSDKVRASLPLTKSPWIATHVPEEIPQRPLRRRLS
jgi:ubiquitin-protein ligase